MRQGAPPAPPPPRVTIDSEADHSTSDTLRVSVELARIAALILRPDRPEEQAALVQRTTQADAAQQGVQDDGLPVLVEGGHVAGVSTLPGLRPLHLLHPPGETVAARKRGLPPAHCRVVPIRGHLGCNPIREGHVDQMCIPARHTSRLYVHLLAFRWRRYLAVTHIRHICFVSREKKNKVYPTILPRICCSTCCTQSSPHILLH